jgi:hypothetical protein
MQIKIIEATNVTGGGINWGKFLLGRFDTEWERRSVITDSSTPLLHQIGWDRNHLWVMDLQTGEGAMFRPGGSAEADLHKRQIWVCPMFEPFLIWLYTQNLRDLATLPNVVHLSDAPSAMWGYRRPGIAAAEINRLQAVETAARQAVDAYEYGTADAGWPKAVMARLTEKLRTE